MVIKFIILLVISFICFIIYKLKRKSELNRIKQEENKRINELEEKARIEANKRKLEEDLKIKLEDEQKLRIENETKKRLRLNEIKKDVIQRLSVRENKEVIDQYIADLIQEICCFDIDVFLIINTLHEIITVEYKIINYIRASYLNEIFYKSALMCNFLVYKELPDKYRDKKIINDLIRKILIDYTECQKGIKSYDDAEFINSESYLTTITDAIDEYLADMLLNIDHDAINYIPVNVLNYNFYFNGMKSRKLKANNIPLKYIDDEIAKLMIDIDPRNFSLMSHIKHNKHFVSKFIKINGLILQCVPINIIDKEICKSAVKNNIQSYKYLPDDLIDYDIASYCFSKFDFIRIKYEEEDLYLTVNQSAFNDKIQKMLSLIFPNSYIANNTKINKSDYSNILYQKIIDNCVIIKLSESTEDPVFMHTIKRYRVEFESILCSFIPSNYTHLRCVNSKHDFIINLSMDLLKILNEIRIDADTQITLYFNLHKLNRYQGEKIIDDILIYLKSSRNSVILIHGYHHGKILKNLIDSKLLFQKEISKYRVSYNEGRTELRRRRKSLYQ